MLNRLTHAITFALALAVVGCDDSDPVTPSDADNPEEPHAESSVAWFQLVGVDDLRIPHVVSTAAECQEIYMGGWLKLSADDEFYMEVDRVADVCEEEVTGPSFTVIHGTYSISGEEIHFDTGSGTPIVGEYAPFVQLSESSALDGTIEVRVNGRAYKFRDERRRSALW